jgi:hypothetical protein
MLMNKEPLSPQPLASISAMLRQCLTHIYTDTTATCCCECAALGLRAHRHPQ